LLQKALDGVETGGDVMHAVRSSSVSVLVKPSYASLVPRSRAQVAPVIPGTTPGFAHRIGPLRPRSIAASILAGPLSLRLGHGGLATRLLGWPTPRSRPEHRKGRGGGGRCRGSQTRDSASRC